MLSLIFAYMYVHTCIQELDDEEYGRWKEERENAELSVEQRDEKVFQSNCQIEQKLLLLGEFLSLSLSIPPSLSFSSSHSVSLSSPSF